MTHTDYEKQGTDFLEQTGTIMTMEYARTGKYFDDDDKEERDIYTITLNRGNRGFTFEFGQSINCSGRFIAYGNPRRGMSRGFLKDNGEYRKPKNDYAGENKWELNINFSAPTPYGILLCLTKYDPETFENFCSEFGYDNDSRKAEKTYKAVKLEYMQLCTMFNETEMEAMQEIQ